MIIPEGYPDRNVCIIGLGYVGLTLAATMANIGFRVHGVEVREDVVKLLRSGQPHFHEPGLADLLRRVVEGGFLAVHHSLPADCEANVFIITVGTPLGSNGRVRLDMIEHAAAEVAAAMRPGALVIMRSTLKLGTTRKIVLPILDARGIAYDVAFCPERTLEGVALQELRSLPQIVGGGDLGACVRAAQLFQFITPTTLRVHDLETAEMIKLVDNAQRDVHFAFSNEVARMCDAIGISAVDVITAGKLGYPRTNLAMPGPVGGPCLEKDPYILAEGLEPLGLTPEITLAARRLNERQPEEVLAAVWDATRGCRIFRRVRWSWCSASPSKDARRPMICAEPWRDRSWRRCGAASMRRSGAGTTRWSPPKHSVNSVLHPTRPSRRRCAARIWLSSPTITRHSPRCPSIRFLPAWATRP